MARKFQKAFFELTPNPSTRKITFNEKLPASGTTLTEKVNVVPSLNAVFDVVGVKSVFIGDDFLSLTLSTPDYWDVASVQEHLEVALQSFLSGCHTSFVRNDNEPEPRDPVVKQIIDLIDQYITPSVATDGGRIVFKEFKDGVLTLDMQGACAGCPSATATIKMGVERLLKRFIPQITSVVTVTSSI